MIPATRTLPEAGISSRHPVTRLFKTASLFDTTANTRENTDSSSSLISSDKRLWHDVF